MVAVTSGAPDLQAKMVVAWVATRLVEWKTHWIAART